MRRRASANTRSSASATKPEYPMAKVTLLLPAASRLAGRLPLALATAMGRADIEALDAPGERAQLLRHFDVVPRGWAIAALTRQRDAGDAAGSMWLRADPAW